MSFEQSMATAATEGQKLEKAQKSLLGRFREGIANTIGKVGAFLVILTVPNVMKGTEIETEKLEQPKMKYQMSLSVEQINQLESTDKTTEFLKVTSENEDELEILKNLEPDSVEVGNKKITLDYSQGARVKNQEKTVVTGKVDTVSAKDVPLFTWGEKDFSKAEVKDPEVARIKTTVKQILDKEIKPYQEWKIDLNTALEKITVDGSTFSSPEGDSYKPKENVKLSQNRAKLVTQVVKEILEKDYGLDASKVEIKVEGMGSHGSVLDFARGLEKSGYTFKTNNDGVKIEKAEKIIRLLNTKKIDEAYNMIKGQGKISKEDFVKLFKETIANKRSLDLEITIIKKDVEVITAKKELPPAPKTRGGNRKTESTGEISRGEIVTDFVQEFAKEDPEEQTESTIEIPTTGQLYEPEKKETIIDEYRKINEQSLLQQKQEEAAKLESLRRKLTGADRGEVSVAARKKFEGKYPENTRAKDTSQFPGAGKWKVTIIKNRPRDTARNHGGSMTKQ